MVYRFIISKRYHNLLKALSNAKDKNSQEIARDTNMTTAHLSRVLSQFTAEGLLIRHLKDGRENQIRLTKKGVEVLFGLDKIEKIFNDEIKTKLEKEE